MSNTPKGKPGGARTPGPSKAAKEAFSFLNEELERLHKHLAGKDVAPEVQVWVMKQIEDLHTNVLKLSTELVSNTNRVLGSEDTSSALDDDSSAEEDEVTSLA